MTKITLVTGDITQQPDTDCIVNAANAQLEKGNGVCGAIFKAAGAQLVESCREFPLIEGVRCSTGNAVVTPAHNLLSKAIIHAVGPIWDSSKGDECDTQLGNAYIHSLNRARDLGYGIIAFPAISCGIYGYPLDRAARVAMDACQVWVEAQTGDTCVQEIRFVFLPSDTAVKEAFEKAV